MKRIFLTSGLVVCMACPAFADLLQNQTIDPSGAAATCQYPTLEGYSGTSTFTAKWTRTYQIIDLDINEGTTAATGGLSGESFTPDPLYSVPGNSHVWTGLDNNQNLTGNSGAGYADGEAGLLTVMPQYGISVNYNLNANGGNIGTASSTGGNRPYLGVYDQSGTTQYINTSGVLTSEGASAASSNTSGTTWYAKYGTVTPTVTGTPTRTGYTHVGWNTDQNATEDLQSYPAIADNTTTLYAIWDANGYTISYDCGQPTGASVSTTVVGPTIATQDIDMDGHYTLAGADNCTLQGYTFAGWSCPNLPGAPTLPANAQTPTYFAGAAEGTYSYAGDVECTAQWTPNTINLSWNDNNATTAHVGGDSTCTFDSTIGLPTQVPQRTGYEFGGWDVVNTAASN